MIAFLILLGTLNGVFPTDSSPTVPEPRKTYTNPLGNITRIGDPYILKVDTNYYLYATSSANGFKVWQSSDLVSWTEKGLALDKNNPLNRWGKGNFWAPEVKFYRNSFYMTYSAIDTTGKMKIRIARSSEPTGPFINWSPPLFQKDDFSYIDSNLLIDNDKVYIFYVKDCSTNIIDGKHISQIYVNELDQNLKTAIGEPKLILTPDQEWEALKNDWKWNEGPYVIKVKKLYYLFYSANAFNNPNYSVGYAISSSPQGPWTKFEGNPILKKNLNLKVSGPGHCCITSSPDNTEFFIVYHTHTLFDKPGGDRNLCIDRITFKNGKVEVAGPTRSPQPFPSSARLKTTQ